MSGGVPIQERFTLGAMIGRGAWGDVHKARDRVTGRVVAVKRMHATLEDANAAERFHREARMLAALDHAHVVRYVAHGDDEDGRPCLVVEWLDGQDVARRQRTSRLRGPQIVEVARQAALGLHALHEAGIVHRDVKPANIFLVKGEGDAIHVKLIDLGVARASLESTITLGGIMVGTPFYMSPEQARGSDHVDARADQFSLGVVLYELFAGRRPFAADDIFAVLAKIVLQDPPRLRDAVPAVPDAIDALVRRAMSRAPDERFGSARELAEALARLPRWDGEAHEVPVAEADPPTLLAPMAVSATSEQRVVTAVFAGFAAWVPEDRGAAAFTAIAEEHGASCHPTLGRRVIAVFGGARTTGDEATRAARAALVAAERVPGVRLAISTGRALSGTTGIEGALIERGAGDLDREGGAVRAGAVTGPSPVRVDEPTARLLADQFVIVEQGAERVLQGRRSAVAPPRTLVGRPTPFVGRERELGAIEGTFAECAGEPVARAVLITGPTGIGKSRLRHELLSRFARAPQPPLVLFASASAASAGSAFGLLAPAIRRLCGVLDGEAPGAQRDKLAARIGLRLPPHEAPAVVRLLGELCSVPFDAAPHHEDAMLAADRMRAAFVRWLGAECQSQSVVIVLEDMQWGDLPTAKFIDAALRDLGQRPLLVLALARPEVHDRFPRLWAEREVQELRMGPLTRRASERLVREVLGGRIDEAALQLVLSRAEGNAFYLEELIRAVAEGVRDALPDTVLGMVQARLDALGPSQKRILRAASVFGMTFWAGGAAALIGGGESQSQLARALDDLCASEVTTRRETASFPGEIEYTFRHTLVRDAAYAMLADTDRVVGHRLAGTWLEAAGEGDPALLALHFERGGVLDRASHFLLAAARRALTGNDFAGAIAYAERSIATGDVRLARGDARLVQAEAHRWSADLRAAAGCAAEAAELLPKGTIAWFHAVRETIAATGRLGRIDELRTWTEEAIRADAPPEAVGAHVACLVPAAVHFLYAGEPDAVARVTEKIEDVVARAGALHPTVTARLHQLWAARAQQRGDREAALEQQKAALGCFEEAGDMRGACLSRSNLGFALAELGCFVEAEHALRRAHASAQRMGLSTIAPLALQNLGVVLSHLGQTEEAHAVLTASAEAFRGHGDPRLEAASRVHLAILHARAGDLRAAEEQARRVVDSQPAQAPLRAAALAALSVTLRLAGLTHEALTVAEEGARILEKLGTMEELESLLRAAYAEALDATGDRDGARAVITEAQRRLVAQARRLRDPELRERFLTAVPDHARCLELALQWGVPPVSS